MNTNALEIELLACSIVSAFVVRSTVFVIVIACARLLTGGGGRTAGGWRTAADGGRRTAAAGLSVAPVALWSRCSVTAEGGHSTAGTAGVRRSTGRYRSSAMCRTRPASKHKRKQHGAGRQQDR